MKGWKVWASFGGIVVLYVSALTVPLLWMESQEKECREQCHPRAAWNSDDGCLCATENGWERQ